MPSLLSMLAAVPLLSLTALLFGLIIAQALDWLSMPARWMPSRLPEHLLDDPAYDAQCDGWWCEDWLSLQEPPLTGPGFEFDGLVYRWAPEGNHLQFLLPAERVVSQDPRVWVILYGARL